MTFLGLLAYLFFFFIRLQDWWEPLKGIPVDDIVISFILISLLPSLSRLSNILRLPQTKFLLLFLVAAFLSNIANGNMNTAFEYGLIYLKYTLIFLAIAISVDSFPKLKWLTLYILLLIVFIAFQGIIQAKTGTNWAGMSLYRDDSRIRWVGIFDGSNTTALAFIVMIPFALEYFFGPWGWHYKLFSSASGCLLLIGLYLTESRGGFLALLMVLLSFVCTKIKGKKGLVLGLMLAVIVLGVALPMSTRGIDDADKSSRGRIHAWGEALEMVRYHNPLFGVGKGQFTNYTRRVAHNAFLQHLGESGFIGAFFWVGIVYTTLKGLVKVLRGQNQEPFRKSIYTGYFLAFIALLAGTMFISADHELFYLLSAFCASIVLVEGIDLRLVKKDLVIAGCITTTGVIFFYIVVNLFKIMYF